MQSKIITDNGHFDLRVKWDGIRFGIIAKYKSTSPNFPTTNVILFKPQEAKKIAHFLLHYPLA